MIDYTITTDAYRVAQVFERELAVANNKAAAITERNGNELLNIVQALSPYRTGEYKRSHQISLVGSGSMYSAEVYTDLERGAMLEFGGTQVMGDGTAVERPPRPHYRPAFEFVSAKYFEELYTYMQP